MPRTSRKSPKLALPTVANKKRTYAERTGANQRASKIWASTCSQPTVEVDEEGYVVRDWANETIRLTIEDTAVALRYERVVEMAGLLQYISPSAIKYAVAQGWIRKDPKGGFFWVTEKAADEGAQAVHERFRSKSLQPRTEPDRNRRRVDFTQCRRPPRPGRACRSISASGTS